MPTPSATRPSLILAASAIADSFRPTTGGSTWSPPGSLGLGCQRHPHPAPRQILLGACKMVCMACLARLSIVFGTSRCPIGNAWAHDGHRRRFGAAPFSHAVRCSERADCHWRLAMNELSPLRLAGIERIMPEMAAYGSEFAKTYANHAPMVLVA